MKRRRPLPSLEKRLGYAFSDRDLAERALTHSSARGAKLRKADNERLEFIGDRVLGLVIAERLGQDMPSANEGQLARKFNQLVRKETCALVARNIRLGEHLILSESEDDSGGREKDTILADAMEALLAAVFMDGGFEAARDVVRRLWADAGGELPERIHDPKSALQEWAQGKGLPLPKYVEVGRSGPDHAPVFAAEVRVKSLEPTRGEGPSKRVAEQAAATDMLIREGVWRAKPNGR